MNVGIIMPHRGDRPKFLEQFHRLIQKQTIVPSIIEIIDYTPLNNNIDITQRYRIGYDNLRGKGLDCILFMEIDDWYSPYYIETMVSEWVKYGRPKMYGLNYTVYYHLFIGKSFLFKHENRSSMMSTLIRPDMDIEWCRDDYAYTDSHLWKTICGKVSNPRKDIAIGLKHGIGKTGGRWHRDNLQRYKDSNIDFRKIVGDDDFAFYRSLYPSGVRLERNKALGLYLAGL